LNNSLKIFDVVMHVHTQVFLVVTHATMYLKVYSLICFIRMLNQITVNTSRESSQY